MCPLPSVVEEQSDQQMQTMSARKVTSILITGIVVLAGFLAAVVFLSFNWLDSIGDQVLEEELKEIPPPTWPIPSVVVNDIETLADFGYRKIDTVAHALSLIHI